jgi:hypothetical protein
VCRIVDAAGRAEGAAGLAEVLHVDAGESDIRWIFRRCYRDPCMGEYL